MQHWFLVVSLLRIESPSRAGSPVGADLAKTAGGLPVPDRSGRDSTWPPATAATGSQGLRADFEHLAEARQGLRSRADLLKSRIWDLQLPRADANRISEALHRAYAYLKNPPMLGAYHDRQQLRRERKKIAAMMADLQQAEAIVDAHKNNNG